MPRKSLSCATIRRRKTFLISRRTSRPRGVLHCWARPNGKQKIENTGPLTKKRMETVDEEFLAAAKDFITKANKSQETVLCMVQHLAHAFPHSREAQKPGPVGALAI